MSATGEGTLISHSRFESGFKVTLDAAQIEGRGEGKKRREKRKKRGRREVVGSCLEREVMRGRVREGRVTGKGWVVREGKAKPRAIDPGVRFELVILSLLQDASQYTDVIDTYRDSARAPTSALMLTHDAHSRILSYTYTSLSLRISMQF